MKFSFISAIAAEFLWLICLFTVLKDNNAKISSVVITLYILHFIARVIGQANVQMKLKDAITDLQMDIIRLIDAFREDTEGFEERLENATESFEYSIKDIEPKLERIENVDHIAITNSVISELRRVNEESLNRIEEKLNLINS